MIGHYFATALARFRATPFATTANVLTLALGLACFIAAYGIATYWRLGDAYHPGADRIYYISQQFGDEPTGPLGKQAPIWSSRRLASDLRAEIPELEVVAQIQGQQGEGGAVPISSGEARLFLKVASTGPDILDLFAFDFVEGEPRTALRAPNDVIITESAARRLFGRAPALGKSLRVFGQFEVNVSGVIAPVRQPSFMGHTSQSPIAFEALFNSALFNPDIPENWGSIGGTTFVRLPESMPLTTFQARLDDIAARANYPAATIHLTAAPISKIVSQIVDAQFISGRAAGASTSLILLVLGALILVVSCVNYANLAFAQAESRFKETGMRKVLGAGRRALLAQHVVEAGLLAIPAVCLATAVVALSAPIFRNLLGVDVIYALTADPRTIGLLLTVAVASTVVAVVYPALKIASVRAVDALGQGKTRAGSGVISRVLVGVQFLSASFLLIFVTVTQMQHAHLKAIAFGAERDPVIILDQYTALGVDFETFRSQLMRAPQIRSVTASTLKPWTEEGRSRSQIFTSGPDGRPPVEQFYLIKAVGKDYFETFGRKVLAGRVFDPERDRTIGGLRAPPNSSTHANTEDPAPPTLNPVVIDRRLANALWSGGPQQAVGQVIYLYYPQTETTAPVGEVIGVVEADDPALGTAYSGVLLEFDPDYRFAQQPAIRIDPGDVSGAIAAITQVWNDLSADIAARPLLAEDLFEQTYAPFRKVSTAFLALSGFAIAISTTGLLGIAVYVASRRRREIAVRKTLGSSLVRVVRLLLKDFSIPVLIGNLLAWPLAYLATEAYLSAFAIRIDLTLAPFALSMAITLLIAWAAVIGVVLKAASVQPAEVLRHA